ncbi:sterile alpha motif domain-containing protein 9-like [Toxotes jaculatrix]|uniref:sterile alpha motif domain-containing protein 9-like n=1 Tax=Toxotes jaculatrix TaxID=941984 RepID=UPI001B3A9912|nr:sterile alpha motif domain-containing protein 9-like [Toxotes jaculatrix]XP_040913027.1 sterile alpha motif domain-containing protein 9-like [Toxotes jaculatrix]
MLTEAVMAGGVEMKNEEEILTPNIKQTHLKEGNVDDRGTARDEQIKKDQQRPCKPYPFGKYHDSHRYIINNILDIIESGPLDMIEPCHEYKAFINTKPETEMVKFCPEVIRIAAACMNSRTNSTIHFGIGDAPDFIHGQVLGVKVRDKEAFAQALNSAIAKYFEPKQRPAAHFCIKPPRFVEVLDKNMTSSNKYVIEVDIIPNSIICEENIYHTYRLPKKAKKKAKIETNSKQFFVRDGGSSRDLLAPTTSAKPMQEYNKFVDGMKQRSQLRKQAEEKSLAVAKSNCQGTALIKMITGGSPSLDASCFDRYVIVTNKSHSSQFESLGFLVELNPTAVLDFDPESAKHGLQCHFKQHSAVNLPAQYKITGQIKDTVNTSELGPKISWIFCNGGVQDEPPSDMDQWLMDKGASIQDLIYFLCHKDVVLNKRFLVIFLLLSCMNEEIDPLVETFCKFQKELGDKGQILCICDSEKAFTSWKDLIDARCEINISDRCIYDLSFAEVNGTILSLFSKNRKSSRFLTGGGGSRVLLKTEVEHSLSTLEVLCVNQCEGGDEDKTVIDQNFYRGGKVSWWNFYFSEQLGFSNVVKRNKVFFIEENVAHVLHSQKKACVLFNLIHVPGCGGTTLAMHTLWNLRHKFRCAVLKDKNANFSEVADQVVKLLMCGHEEKLLQVPVLLMIDDFDDMQQVSDLQQLIDRECTKNDIKSAKVILLNCMRSWSCEFLNRPRDTLFLENNLSEEEKKQFSLKETVETFYDFMIRKNNLKPEYVQGVVHNTLRSFSSSQKNAQLLAVLTILNVHHKDVFLPVSLCQEFLGLQPDTDTVQEEFGKLSDLICHTTVKSELGHRAVKMIYPHFARCCYQELTTTHKMTEADFINLLQKTVELISTEGKGKYLQDVFHRSVEILAKGKLSVWSDSRTEGEIARLEEKELVNASKRLEKEI